MKRMIVVTLLLVMAAVVFAQDAVTPATENDAVALITRQATRLRLARADRTAATTALKEMVRAGIQVRNAWQLVSDSLDEGLKAREMKSLAQQVRTNSRQGLSAGECETAAQSMIRDRIQARDQSASGTATQTQTQTQTRTGASTSSETQAGSGSGAGSQAGKGN
jgi:hypothetical protein